MMAFDRSPHFEFVWGKEAPYLVISNGASLTTELHAFAAKYNTFIDTQNRAAMFGNLLAAVGYVVAGITSGLAALTARKEMLGSTRPILTASPAPSGRAFRTGALDPPSPALAPDRALAKP